jgi:protein phosphatase
MNMEVREAVSAAGIRVAAATSVGRVRTRNEDAFLLRPDLGLFVVADGMGGHLRGDVAARTCVETIDAWFSDALPSEVRELMSRGVRAASGLRSAAEIELLAAVELANRHIYDKGRASPTHRGMGTTLVSALFRGAQMFAVWSGDSRIYRLREGRLRLVSKDHSLLNEYIKLHMVRPAEAREFPHRNVITKALGLRGRADVEFLRRRVRSGDCYLMCSDGLNDMIDDQRIAEVLSGPGTLGERCEALIDAALDAGGVDNVTVLLAEIP